MKRAEKSIYEELSDVLVRPEMSVLNGRNLFEKMLWERGRVDLAPERPYDERPLVPETLEYPLACEIGVLEGLVSYYHDHYVADDDLDVIRDVMVRAYEDLEMYEEDPEYAQLLCSYERAKACLGAHHLVFSDSWEWVAKALDEVEESRSRTGSWGRDWGQVQWKSDVCETVADIVPDDGSRTPDEMYDDHVLSERIREVLNTLTPQQRMVLDLRFGLSDGYPRLLEEVGRLFNVTRERIRQIEARALRRLRHPARMHALLKVSASEWLRADEDEERKPQPFVRAADIADNQMTRSEVAAVLPKYATVSVPEKVHTRNVTIGRVRMTVREWMDQLGLTDSMLTECMAVPVYKIAWTTENVAGALVLYLRKTAESIGVAADDVLAAVGGGYSLMQIAGGRTNEHPENLIRLMVDVGDDTIVVGDWFERQVLSEADRAKVMSEMCSGGKVDVGPMVEYVKWHEKMVAERKAAEKERRKNPLIRWQGQEKSAAEWSAITGMPRSAIVCRVNSGWDPEDAMTIPYPCGELVQVKGRRYVKADFKKHFGMTYEEYLKQ